MHVDPFNAAAGLAGVEHSSIDEVFHRMGEVRVVADVSWILASKLQRSADESIQRGLLDRVPSGNRSSERDEGDAWVADDLRRVVMAEMEELKDSFR